jgi:hexosaminidase
MPVPIRAALAAMLFAVIPAFAVPATPLIPAPAETRLTEKRIPRDTPGHEVVDTTLPPEGFRISFAPGAITLAHADAAGLLYGRAALATLRETAGADGLAVGVIEDRPRFRHRGLMLDESRHFFGKAFVLRLLGLMAEHRLNTFHWHLTDGPGWRIEIPAYPKLTDIGAWREDDTGRPWDWRSTRLSFTGKKPGDIGGFYTEADIREVLARAKSLGIAVIPEIEMPGHAYAALVAYPETACNPASIRTEGLRGRDVFCATSPEAERLLEAVVDRTAALFPDAPYLHLGGDEVPDTVWKNCPRCAALKEKLGLRTHGELGGVFIRRLAERLAAKGRRVMLWDEAADLPLPPDAALTVWRTGAATEAARRSGHPRVLCPIDRLYFDYGQTRDGRGEPRSAGPGLTLEKVYAFEPSPGGADDTTLLGVQANLWTEHVVTPEQAERLLLPRLCALAEIAWSPRASRDFKDFSARLPAHLEKLRARGYRVFGDR